VEFFSLNIIILSVSARGLCHKILHLWYFLKKPQSISHLKTLKFFEYDSEYPRIFDYECYSLLCPCFYSVAPGLYNLTAQCIPVADVLVNDNTEPPWIYSNFITVEKKNHVSLAPCHTVHHKPLQAWFQSCCTEPVVWRISCARLAKLNAVVVKTLKPVLCLLYSSQDENKKETKFLWQLHFHDLLFWAHSRSPLHLAGLSL
jgi:hypothetical protein